MTIIVHADGGARGNPGPAALGVVVFKDDRLIEEFKEYLGEATNNVAEYSGVKRALELASSHTKEDVHVFLDSELAVKQLNGEYKVRMPHLKRLYDEVRELEKRFETVTYEWVPRSHEKQTMADALVNQVLDARG